MKELLVEGVNKDSNVSIHLCKLVKLDKLGNAVDVKHILENTFLFLLTIVVLFFYLDDTGVSVSLIAMFIQIEKQHE